MSKCFILLSIAVLSTQIAKCSGVSSLSLDLDSHLEAYKSKQESFNKATQEQIDGYKYRIDTQEARTNNAKTVNQIPKLQKAADPVAAAIQNLIIKNCLPFGNLTAIRMIKVPGSKAFKVPCDSRFAGPGWTVIMRREDRSVKFDRNWTDYRNGFGDLNGEFWLGLEQIHLLTISQPHELYVYMGNFEHKTKYARYDAFVIGNENELYELKVLGDYSGNAKDAFRQFKHTDITYMKFSTRDRKNDQNKYGNCSNINNNGGWWFNACSSSPLTARYRVRSSDRDYKQGDMYWYDPYKLRGTIKFVQMMIRPKAT